MKVTFTCGKMEQFIQRDVDILKKQYDVDEVLFTKYSKLGFIRTIKKSISSSDFVFGWFAGLHSAIAVHYAKKYGKKSIIVAGGYDVAYLPEINYGAFTKKKEKYPAKYALKNADLVISVSKSNQKELLEKIKPKKNTLIYNAVPIKDFYPGDDKKQMVITVGTVKQANLYRKGIETFVKVAKYVPDIPFVVVGRFEGNSITHLKAMASSNVTFTGFVTDDMLLEWYQEAKVYLQPSAHEAFGISVAEAMLCKCIPVVTDRFALPEVVGDTGLYIPYDNPEIAANVVKEALKLNTGTKARNRIKKMYSIEKREVELINEIEGIL